MTAWNAVESKARPAPIRPENPDAGQMGNLAVLRCFHGQHLCQSAQLFHILPQLPGERRTVQIEPQNKRRGHPAKHSFKLGQHIGGKYAALYFCRRIGRRGVTGRCGKLRPQPGPALRRGCPSLKLCGG